MDFMNSFLSFNDDTESFFPNVEFIDFNDVSTFNDENIVIQNEKVFKNHLIIQTRKKPIFRQHVKWTKVEDEKLRLLVKEFGENDWRHLAKRMEGRNSRQCRERWQYYLNPNLKLGNWTQEEDELILQKREELGPRWMAISKFFENRTDAMIKNRYNVLLRIKNKKVFKNNEDLNESIFVVNNQNSNDDVNTQSSQIENSNKGEITVQSSKSKFLDDCDYFTNEENLNSEYIFENNCVCFENDDMNIFVY